jgi:hypothetical protein
VLGHKRDSVKVEAELPLRDLRVVKFLPGDQDLAAGENDDAPFLDAPAHRAARR